MIWEDTRQAIVACCAPQVCELQKEQDRCAICLSDLRNDADTASEDVSAVQPSQHRFHTACIRPWVTRRRRNLTCPVCRTNLGGSNGILLISPPEGMPAPSGLPAGGCTLSQRGLVEDVLQDERGMDSDATHLHGLPGAGDWQCNSSDTFYCNITCDFT